MRRSSLIFTTQLSQHSFHKTAQVFDARLAGLLRMAKGPARLTLVRTREDSEPGLKRATTSAKAKTAKAKVGTKKTTKVAKKKTTKVAKPRTTKVSKARTTRHVKKIAAPKIVETENDLGVDHIDEGDLSIAPPSDEIVTDAASAIVADDPAQAKKKTAAKPKDLVQRVYNTIDLELTKLEQQKGVSSQDRERASRALSQMVNSLEKAVDMQRDISNGASKRANAKDKEALRHAEDLRREIAERLERLNRQRTPRRRAGGAE